MPRIYLNWTPTAQSDLREIKAHIAQTAPKNARKYVQKLRAGARRLKLFPESGWVVEEFQNPEIREIVVGSHRIIYRFRHNVVRIITVFLGSRILRIENLENA